MLEKKDFMQEKSGYNVCRKPESSKKGKKRKWNIELKMEYRINRRTGDTFSVIGIGTAYIGDQPHDEAIALLKAAHAQGVNVMDLAAGNARAFEYAGEAFADCREDMLYQVHFGANYETGVYGWTTSLAKVQEQVAWMLETLRTDYIDYGFIHCLDEEKDLEAYQKNGVLDYLLEMKNKGVVRHIGLSTHTPALANKILDLGIVDEIMFSINAGYDHGEGTYANGSQQERQAFYRRCAELGVGITVMKPFAGGQLLDAKARPFGQALSQEQCLQYALDQPAVLCCVPGLTSMEELERLIAFCDADEAVRDYSVLESLQPDKHEAKCVYCSHCHPCPAGLNISLINKYYDLARQGDAMAADHYRKLEKHASDCIACGHCTSRCPFHTGPMARMEEIAAYFEI